MSCSRNSQPEAELQKPKGKVSTFRDFPRTVDFDRIGLCSPFGRWCCLHAGFRGLNGTSTTWAVVLRSGGLLQEQEMDGIACETSLI